MAGGSSGGVLVVHQDENGVLDKTWQVIHDAGFAVLYEFGGQTGFIGYLYMIMGQEGGPYMAAFVGYDNEMWVKFYYMAASADEYPVVVEMNP